MHLSHGAKFQRNSFSPLIILKANKCHSVSWWQPAMAEDGVVTGVWNTGCFHRGGKKGWRGPLAVHSEFNLNLSDKCLATGTHLSIQSSNPALWRQRYLVFHVEQRSANYSSRAKPHGAPWERGHGTSFPARPWLLLPHAGWQTCVVTTETMQPANPKIFPISSFTEICLSTPYLWNP